MTRGGQAVVGILDWGIGGLGFYALLRARHADLPVIYWSDGGSLPYGKLPADELALRVAEVARAMAQRGVTHLAVACNAASSVLRRVPAAAWPEGVSVCGIIGPAIAAVRALKEPGTVGVIAGRRTVLSNAYRRGLEGLAVRQRIAQPLSAFIERGELEGAALEATLTRIMRPLRGVDTLVMACTHYPAIAGALARHAPTARLLDPAAALLEQVETSWPLAGAGGPAQFLTTGNPGEMRRAAKAAFGVDLVARAVRGD